MPIFRSDLPRLSAGLPKLAFPAAALKPAWLRVGAGWHARLLISIVCVASAGCACLPPSSRPAPAPAGPTSIFPMADYDQSVDHWISPTSTEYDRPFLSEAEQRTHFAALTARYFGVGADDPSPWNPAFVAARVYRFDGRDIAAMQRRRIARFDNAAKPARYIGYGQNLRPHTAAWLDAIARNMDLAQFDRVAGYAASQRAIATDNLLVRGLPTLDPSFYNSRFAGEGYPFDNLQISAIKPGTPLYILGTSVDGGWRYVQTPDVQGWVRSTGLALVDGNFVDAWRAAARQSLGAIVDASVAVRDTSGAFRFDAPAGTVLPLVPPQAGQGSAMPAVPATAVMRAIQDVLVPARDVDGRALLRRARLPTGEIVPMPWSATPRHLGILLKALVGRPYGWGNTGFYNDCSSELQSIFAPLGVWLPRHSSNQMDAGAMVDLSASTPAQRIDYLVQHGAPFKTIIYIGGHVMLYLGNTVRDNQPVPLVYQDVWGLRPADDSRRAVIGGSVITPLLLRIPEDPTLQSLAGTDIFQVMVLGAPKGREKDHEAAPASDDDPAS